MNTIIKNKQGTGKTTVMVGASIHHVKHDGYCWSEVYGNVYMPGLAEFGYHHLTNDALREFVGDISRKGLRHMVILIDEIAKVFPARWYADRKQQEALIGLFQDEKLFNLVYATAHAGTSYDKLMRDARQKTVVPFYDQKKKPDYMPYCLIDDLNKSISWHTMYNVKWVQRHYSRWDFVY